MKKPRFKFAGRSTDGTQYFWESVGTISPYDSRHERITVNINWFWNTHGQPGTEACS